MDPRVGPCPARRPRIARWTSVLAISGLAATGAATASAAGLEPFRQVRLVRVANDSLRIEWRAAVRETGGAFVLSRSQPAGARLLVARVLPVSAARYRVTDSAEPGAWIYELRYRDARGRERLLAVVELNLDELERGTAAASFRSGLGPAAVSTEAAASGAVPAPFPIAVADDDGLPIVLRGRPPTPPPRAHA